MSIIRLEVERGAMNTKSPTSEIIHSLLQQWAWSEDLQPIVNCVRDYWILDRGSTISTSKTSTTPNITYRWKPFKNWHPFLEIRNTRSQKSYPGTTKNQTNEQQKNAWEKGIPAIRFDTKCNIIKYSQSFADNNHNYSTPHVERDGFYLQFSG